MIKQFHISDDNEGMFMYIQTDVNVYKSYQINKISTEDKHLIILYQTSSNVSTYDIYLSGNLYKSYSCSIKTKNFNQHEAENTKLLNLIKKSANTSAISHIYYMYVEIISECEVFKHPLSDHYKIKHINGNENSMITNLQKIFTNTSIHSRNQISPADIYFQTNMFSLKHDSYQPVFNINHEFYHFIPANQQLPSLIYQTIPLPNFDSVIICPFHNLEMIASLLTNIYQRTGNNFQDQSRLCFLHKNTKSCQGEFYIYVSNNKPQGYLIALHYVTHVEIYDVYVFTESRSKKVASNLIKVVKENTWQELIWLGVFYYNPYFTYAVNAYLKQGFTFVYKATKTLGGIEIGFFIGMIHDKNMKNNVDTSKLYQNIISTMPNDKKKECFQTYQFNVDTLRHFQEFLNLGYEVGGHLGSTRINGENKFELKLFLDENGSPYIYRGSSDNYSVGFDKASEFMFHTHPRVCYVDYKCMLGWASGDDMFVHIKNFENIHANVVVTCEGLYIYQLTTKMQYVLYQMKEIFDEIYGWQSSPYHLLADTIYKIIKNDFDSTLCYRSGDYVDVINTLETINNEKSINISRKLRSQQNTENSAILEEGKDVIFNAYKDHINSYKINNIITQLPRNLAVIFKQFFDNLKGKTDMETMVKLHVKKAYPEILKKISPKVNDALHNAFTEYLDDLLTMMLSQQEVNTSEFNQAFLKKQNKMLEPYLNMMFTLINGYIDYFNTKIKNIIDNLDENVFLLQIIPFDDCGCNDCSCIDKKGKQKIFPTKKTCKKTKQTVCKLLETSFFAVNRCLYIRQPDTPALHQYIKDYFTRNP